jgi:hypothetical protein
MIIIGIDVGYHNMALVESITDEDFNTTVEAVHHVNLTKLPHRCVSFKECTLNHTSEVADLMAHFFQEYGNILDKADRIIVERQPPTGLTQIETLLLYVYRSKTVLVSPNSMHSHFNIGHLEYERRKEQTVRIASPYLDEFENYLKMERKHDISDAVCMILFHLYPEKERERIRKVDRTMTLDSYRFTGS